MNFKEYINSRRISDNPRGAFIKDAQADLTMPDNFKSWRDMQAYLEGRSVGEEAIRAAKIIWGQYRNYLSDNG